VESFVTTDRFVAEAEARHESAFFEPEYGAARAGEENAFDGGKCSAKLALVGLHHLRAQLALRWTHGTVLMAWSRCSFSFGYEEGVRFAVDVLDCNLEAIEALGFGGRDFSGEVAT
jgi:hypothetical protein